MAAVVYAQKRSYEFVLNLDQHDRLSLDGLYTGDEEGARKLFSR